MIRAEVAIRLKGRKNKTDHDEEDGELNNMVWGKDCLLKSILINIDFRYHSATRRVAKRLEI